MEDERLIKDVINICPVGCAYLIVVEERANTADYRFAYVNPAFAEISGLKQEDICEQRLSDIFTEIRGGTFGSYYQQVLKGNSEEIHSYSKYTNSWYKVSAYSPRPGYIIVFFGQPGYVRGNDSRPPELQISGEELESYKVRLIKQAKETFNKRRDNSILKKVPVGIGIAVKNIITEVNDTLCKMTGYDKEELIGKNIAFLNPKDDEERQDLLLPNISGAREISWQRKDGSLIEILLSSTLVNPREPAEGVTFTAFDFTEKKRAEEALKINEKNFRLIAENTADTISVLNLDLQNIYVSPSIINLTGYTAEESIQLSMEQILTPQSYEVIRQVLKEEMALEKSGEADPARSRLLELEANCKDGTTIWMENKVSFIRDKNLKPKAILSVSRDISMRKRAEDEIFKQKAHFEALFTNTNDAMVFFDKEERVVNINSQFTKMFGYEREEAIGKNVNSLIDPMGVVLVYNSSRTLKGETTEMEAVRYSKTGKGIQVSLKGGPVYIDGVITGAYAVYTDISERKHYEEELKYLSLHDKLTGLYNRAFFEAELNRLAGSRDYPISIISVDVDGLKIINDTLGHHSGDQLLKTCAGILKESLRCSDILARIGGDEFTVLLPNTDEQTGEMLTWRIRSNVEVYNSKNPKRQLSVSVGIATAESKECSLEDTLKKADDIMYLSKLRKASSAKSKIIDALFKALGERDYIAEGHAQRIILLCQKIGRAKGLSSSQLDHISLLAQVHDLGKVGIPDKILFKKGPLTEDEWKIMRQHPEKGYRIAVSSPDLAGIADLILKHHEKWDGSGYPLGLEAHEIPIECRILSIADAFDAITNDRPYSKAHSVQHAVEEIKRCSGTQFDPELVDIFTKLINTKEE